MHKFSLGNIVVVTDGIHRGFFGIATEHNGLFVAIKKNSVELLIETKYVRDADVLDFVKVNH